MSFAFLFGPGEFQIATEWDQELFDLDNFGIQLVGPGIVVVPSPGAVGLLARRDQGGTSEAGMILPVPTLRGERGHEIGR